jgi:hypothetical protein
MQSRTPDGPYHDTCILDLSIQFIDIVYADAAHERAVFGHKIRKPKELQPECSTVENQPAIISVGQFEPEPAIEGERVIEITRWQVRYSMVGHSIQAYDLPVDLAATLYVTGSKQDGLTIDELA